MFWVQIYTSTGGWVVGEMEFTQPSLDLVEVEDELGKIYGLSYSTILCWLLTLSKGGLGHNNM